VLPRGRDSVAAAQSETVIITSFFAEVQGSDNDAMKALQRGFA
jgi:hypothetical protein